MGQGTPDKNLLEEWIEETGKCKEPDNVDKYKNPPPVKVTRNPKPVGKPQ
jgi:hypothetical protein